MKGIRRFLAGWLSLTLLGGVCASAVNIQESAEYFTLGIYTTTDMSGKCYNEDPLTGENIADSFLKVASAMAQERTANDGTILVDNGGLLLGTSIAACNMDTEVGADNPMALCLRGCGYDAVSLNGHEFHFNDEIQKAFYETLSDEGKKYPGTPVSALCANEIDVETQKVKTQPYTVRSFQVFGQEFRVGILSFGATGRPDWGLSGVYGGTDFVHGDNTGRSLDYEWNHCWQRILREDENCDFVIVMLPFGRGGGAESMGSVDGEDRVAQFVRNTTGIDLVVAGRDGVPTAAGLLNGEGKAVPIVNGGGSMLTRTVLRIRKNGSSVVAQNRCLALANYPDDSSLKTQMKPYYQSAVSYVEQRIGTLGRGWDDITTHYYAPDDTTNLFHEVQLWATGADLSILSPAMLEGVSLSPLWRGQPTYLTLKDCYSLFKNGDYQLNVIEMTGRQIKDWLECCAGGYTVGADGKVTGGNAGTDQIANLHYEIYVGNPVGSRVENITYQDKLITEKQTFKVAVSAQRISADAAYDEYGWYAATQITAGSDKVLWEGAKSQQFGLFGGSFFRMFTEYVRELEAREKKVTPDNVRGLWSLDGRESAEVLVPVTRMELIERLYECAGSPKTKTVADFSDVGNLPAVNWAYEKGIAKGNGSGRFLPDEVITREQAMVMFFRYDQALGRVPKDGWQIGVTYTDAAKTSAWSADALMWNEIRSYLMPDAENYLRPEVQLMAGELETALERIKGR